MKVLLTGASGFIGRKLSEKLKIHGVEVYKFDGDILDPRQQEHHFQLATFDSIVHLAGISSVPECSEDTQKAFLVNVYGTILTFQSMQKYSPKANFIFASTGQVYKNSFDGLPIDENSMIEPLNFYAQTKRLAESYLVDNSQLENKVTIFRIFNHSHMSQSAHFFMGSIAKQLEDQKQLGHTNSDIQMGDPSLIRDIGCLQDLLQAFTQVVLYPRSGKNIYNISSGVGKSLGALVEEMAKYQKMTVRITSDPSRFRREPSQIIANSLKFQKDYDWTPKGGLSLAELIKSFFNPL